MVVISLLASSKVRVRLGLCCVKLHYGTVLGTLNAFLIGQL